MPGCVTSGRRSCTAPTGRWPRWTGCSTAGAPRTGRSGISTRTSPASSPRRPGCRSSPPIWSTRVAASTSTARARCSSPTPCNSTPAVIRASPVRRWRRSWPARSEPPTQSGCRRGSPATPNGSAPAGTLTSSPRSPHRAGCCCTPRAISPIPTTRCAGPSGLRSMPATTRRGAPGRSPRCPLRSR